MHRVRGARQERSCSFITSRGRCKSSARIAISMPPRRRCPVCVRIALGEIRFGAVSIFINALNLTNVRQTRFDPLIRTTPGLGGTPITEAWAPLDGRTFNVGIRADL
jgi:hypothetical protein